MTYDELALKELEESDIRALLEWRNNLGDIRQAERRVFASREERQTALQRVGNYFGGIYAKHPEFARQIYKASQNGSISDDLFWCMLHCRILTLRLQQLRQERQMLSIFKEAFAKSEDDLDPTPENYAMLVQQAEQAAQDAAEAKAEYERCKALFERESK